MDQELKSMLSLLLGKVDVLNDILRSPENPKILR